MKPNNIKKVRTKKDITQRQLAEMVGTSQQQIQRMETGKQSVRFDLAVKLCDVLGEFLEDLFPETNKVLSRSIKKGREIDDMLLDKDFQSEMRDINIEIDPFEYTFLYRLRGGASGYLNISKPERNRLFRGIQGDRTSTPYVVFDSEGWRIAINLDHLIFCQFLFDPPSLTVDEKGEVKPKEEEELYEAEFYLYDSPEPLSFEVEYDSQEEDEGEFGNIFFTAEMLVDKNELFHFTDANGEVAFISAKDVAMIKVPLWVLFPELHEGIDDDGNEEHGA